jgi:hypothetical protein
MCGVRQASENGMFDLQESLDMLGNACKYIETDGIKKDCCENKLAQS